MNRTNRDNPPQSATHTRVGVLSSRPGKRHTGKPEASCTVCRWLRSVHKFMLRLWLWMWYGNRNR